MACEEIWSLETRKSKVDYEVPYNRHPAKVEEGKRERLKGGGLDRLDVRGLVGRLVGLFYSLAKHNDRLFGDSWTVPSSPPPLPPSV